MKELFILKILMTLYKNDGVFRGTVHIKCAIMGNVLKMHVLLK